MKSPALLRSWITRLEGATRKRLKRVCKNCKRSLRNSRHNSKRRRRSNSMDRWHEIVLYGCHHAIFRSCHTDPGLTHSRPGLHYDTPEGLYEKRAGLFETKVRESVWKSHRVRLKNSC